MRCCSPRRSRRARDGRVHGRLGRVPIGPAPVLDDGLEPGRRGADVLLPGDAQGGPVRRVVARAGHLRHGVGGAAGRGEREQERDRARRAGQGATERAGHVEDLPRDANRLPRLQVGVGDRFVAAVAEEDVHGFTGRGARVGRPPS